jgi:hypothetical protein
MKTARRLITTALFFTALLAATSIQAQSNSAPAAEPVLKAIPDDALGFILVKNLGQTDKAIFKLVAMVQAPPPNTPSLLSLLKSQAGIQEGLDENGSAAIALLPAPASLGFSPQHPTSPYPVVYLPVTDYKKFIAQFQPDDATAETTGVTIAGHALVAGHKDSFAVITLPDHKAQLAKAIASTKGVDSVVESFEPWIGQHQVSFVATPTGSKMLFQQGIAGLKQVRAVMAQLQNAKQSAQVAAAFDMYANILSRMSQEVDAFGVALSVDESNNLSIDSHWAFVPGGAWAAPMKDLKPAAGKPFTGIQATPFVFAGEGVVAEEWAAAMAEFSATWANQMNTASGGEGMTEQQSKEYAEAMRSMMKGIRSMSFVMGSPKTGETLFDGSMGLMKVGDAKSFLSQYEKSLEQLAEITKGQKYSPFKFSDVKKIEIEGQPGLAITMDMSGMLAAMNSDPGAAKLMPLLFGPTGKITMRLIVADKHTLVAAYGSEEHVKQVLSDFKNPKSNFASDPDVAATLKLLPPHAQLVGLVSIKGYMDLIMGMIPAIAPPGALPIKLPELPAMPPIGFAAEAGTAGLNTQMVLPADTIAGLNSFIRHAMGIAGESKKQSIETIKPAR